MAVGTIASLSVSAYTTNIVISFAKPANCTKVIFTVTPKNPNGTAIQKTYTIPAGSVGSNLSYSFTGLISTQKYNLSATPYNGSTAGTARIYYNSTSSPVNTIKMANATVTKPQATVSYNPLTGTVGTNGGVVNNNSSTGSTANGGTIEASDAAGSNTPQFLAGVTDAERPSDLNAPGRISLPVRDLAPNQTYAIKVRAITTNAEGNKIHSEYSSPIYITTPGFSASGTNHLSTNNNGDTQLAGGSIFAGDFGSDVGLIDVVNGTTTGTGVVLNKTGLAGFKSGSKQFYISADTGDAYFSGTVQATIIESTSYSGVTDGSTFSTNGMAINLNNGSITSEQFRIDVDGNAYFKGDVGASTISGSSIVSYIGSTSTTAAQSAANGVNKIYYYKGTGNSITGTAYGNGPNGTQYSVTAGTSGTSPTSPSSTFPAGPLSSASGVRTIDGDTWFVYDGNLIVIAQYTYSTSSSGWIQNKVSGLTIANLDAAVITSGTISASIGITSPQITGGNINGSTITGGVLQTSATGQRILLDGSDDTLKYYSGSIYEAGPATIYPLVTTISGYTFAMTNIYSGTLTTNSNTGGLSVYTASDGAYGAILNGSESYVNTGTFSIQQNFSGTTGSSSSGFVRNSYIRPSSDGNPTSSDGINGDLWFQY